MRKEQVRTEIQGRVNNGSMKPETASRLCVELNKGLHDDRIKCQCALPVNILVDAISGEME